MTEYKSPEQLAAIAIRQLNQELQQLFSECKVVEQAYNTASAIHKAIEKEIKVIKEQNLLNDNASKGRGGNH
jgi:hypothetical protein